jgi:hypothetical protein
MSLASPTFGSETRPRPDTNHTPHSGPASRATLPAWSRRCCSADIRLTGNIAMPMLCRQRHADGVHTPGTAQFETCGPDADAAVPIWSAALGAILSCSRRTCRGLQETSDFACKGGRTNLNSALTWIFCLSGARSAAEQDRTCRDGHDRTQLRLQGQGRLCGNQGREDVGAAICIKTTLQRFHRAILHR